MQNRVALVEGGMLIGEILQFVSLVAREGEVGNKENNNKASHQSEAKLSSFHKREHGGLLILVAYSARRP